MLWNFLFIFCIVCSFQNCCLMTVPGGWKTWKLTLTGARQLAGSTMQLIYSDISKATTLRVPQQSRVPVIQTPALLIELQVWELRLRKNIKDRPEYNVHNSTINSKGAKIPLCWMHSAYCAYFVNNLSWNQSQYCCGLFFNYLILSLYTHTLTKRVYFSTIIITKT